MQMGSMSEVACDDAVAMRIRFDGAAPPPAQMYFRGPVLTRFDGLEWTRSACRPRRRPRRHARRCCRRAERRCDYEATLEPLRLASVPLLEATTDIAPIDGFRIVARDDLQWLADKPVFERLRLKATASTSFVLGPPRRFGELQDDLELPVGFNPRILAWARAFRDERRGASATPGSPTRCSSTSARKASATRSRPATYGRNAVDEFWFDRKEGFCEHFAAAFVVVMRAAGVPARIVTGYQGTDLPPVDGYYVVRQSSAHAWAEFWQTGHRLGARRSDRRGRSGSHRPQHPARAAARLRCRRARQR